MRLQYKRSTASLILTGILLAGCTTGLSQQSAGLDAERRQAMSYTISTLLIRNLDDVFGENDPARRRAAIDEIFTEDCEIGRAHV